jgi:hypothetical protein
MTARVTQRQANAVRDAVAATFAPWVTEDNGPTVNMEFDWPSGPAHPAVVWEGGPFEWTMLLHGGVDEEFGFRVEATEMPAGVWYEPDTYWAIGLYREDT